MADKSREYCEKAGHLMAETRQYYQWGNEIKTRCGLCYEARKQVYKLSRKLASRNQKLKQNYGITLNQREEMLDAQGGVCAICGTREWQGHGQPCVDHCHTTDRVRGILCHSCNSAIGHFREDPNILYSAIEYLNKFTGSTAVE